MTTRWQPALIYPLADDDHGIERSTTKPHAGLWFLDPNLAVLMTACVLTDHPGAIGATCIREARHEGK